MSIHVYIGAEDDPVLDLGEAEEEPSRVFTVEPLPPKSQDTAEEPAAAAAAAAAAVPSEPVPEPAPEAEKESVAEQLAEKETEDLVQQPVAAAEEAVEEPIEVVEEVFTQPLEAPVEAVKAPFKLARATGKALLGIVESPVHALRAAGHASGIDAGTDNTAEEEYTDVAEVAGVQANLEAPSLYSRFPVAYAEFKKDLSAKQSNLDESRIQLLFEKIFTLDVPKGIRAPMRPVEPDNYWYKTVRGRMHDAFRLDQMEDHAWLAGYTASKIVDRPLNYFGAHTLPAKFRAMEFKKGQNHH